ncbi:MULTISPECIES: aspartate/glutamate racemase family protein [Klebsiella]|uniref:Hydantoin racemase n=1 Tax=Klebsiella oxytoca TaxID=571 RepID=A0A6C0L210_KLEOX|nr:MULTISPECIES: aspartate/glutamate racemase family protein [Klebsiella]MDU1522553.1 aspartate/glutamate racemase family protein [Actinomyces sp.]MDU5892220.1 aspartate/glutamate racemase family protein [Atopobium minutum]HBQ5882097.1 aspartate/glutamate racemase family protein [Klebsiella pneumoniae subsp. pneumoniae]HBS3522471.1 aspartate/glutamate racemase family protein [Klebsiella variicola subsp. variicola]HCQ8039514.1 aspartate/glutamate racemase family protein [Klebsiella quasipneumon
MRLLIINPNISQNVTSLIEAEAKRTAAAQTQIIMATARSGVAYIETRFEALLGGHAAAIIAGEQSGNYDALLIAAFGDPGLSALKEVLDVPVVGMTESALMTAAQLGQRFSIIAISPRITSWYRECVAQNGMLSRLASIRYLDSPLYDVGNLQNDYARQLLELSKQAVQEDGADVLIMAGAPLAGLARQLRGKIPIPVVDGVSCGVAQAQALHLLNLAAPQQGSFARPPVKSNHGLDAGLQALLS